MNDNIERRDKLIHGKYRPRKYAYGPVRFHDIPAGILAQLIEEGYIDSGQTKGFSPTMSEICEFINKYSDYTVHGYTTESDGMCVDGVAKPYVAATPEECQEFLRLFRDATKLQVDGIMYAYYE